MWNAHMAGVDLCDQVRVAAAAQMAGAVHSSAAATSWVVAGAASDHQHSGSGPSARQTAC